MRELILQPIRKLGTPCGLCLWSLTHGTHRSVFSSVTKDSSPRLNYAGLSEFKSLGVKSQVEPESFMSDLSFKKELET